jgi:transposase
MGQTEFADRIEVAVMYRREEAVCPRCGRTTAKEHERRLQRKRDRRLRDKTVFLILTKRRFRCLWCRKVFSEADEVFGLRRRSTHRFREHLGQEALHQTVRRLARKEKIGEGLVRRCVAEEIGKKLMTAAPVKTPELMGIDEFAVRKGRLYHTAVCDLTGKTVMAVLEGQGKQKLEEYLSRLPEPDGVKAVAMDMHDPFRQAVQMCLPEARVVVDKFHLIRHVNEALDQVRSRLQGGRWKEGKKRDLFRNRYTLLKGVENLAVWERGRLVRLFQDYPQIREAWLLKESFRKWYRTSDGGQAEKGLILLEQRITQGSMPEFKRLLPTLLKWREEILNYFNYRITNGFVEGKNNRIKTIKRMAYGYRNLENFRLRIMAANPGAEDRLSHLLT